MFEWHDELGDIGGLAGLVVVGVGAGGASRYWLLCERTDSKYFGRYVVGGFQKARSPEAVVDPMEAGMAVVDGDEKLASLVEEIKLAVLRA